MSNGTCDKKTYISILGDSVSTLEGYTEPREAAFYDTSMKFEADVFTPSDTWWGQVIAHMGAALLVNHSISGSMVCRHPRCESPTYGCSDERVAALARDGLVPDIIMVYLGTNDWGCGARPTPCGEADAADLAVFSVAYRSMLQKLRARYPQADIRCFTPAVSTCRRREEFTFPYRYAGRHIEEYCEVIRACAAEYGCRVIDLYRNAAPYDTVDGFHPNAAGMRTLAEAVIAQL